MSLWLLLSSRILARRCARRLFSRVGFVLLPVSVLLIKYYPYLGRAYSGGRIGIRSRG